MNPFRFDSVELPETAVELRKEVRDFLAEHRDFLKPSTPQFNPEFSRLVASRGWIGMTWPKTYGGHERTALERYIVQEELLASRAPIRAHWIGERQSGMAILRLGTEEQREFFIPKMTAGECYFAIGMSEPNAGSDLAGARTRADKVDGGFVVNGSKIWTSYAHRCDFMILFCRTPNEGGEIDRHSGVSQLLVDLKSPGIDVRPIRNMAGDHSFNEVFFTDLFVPDNRLLGTIGGGWKQVTAELSLERSAPDRFLSTFDYLEKIVEHAGTQPDRTVASAVGKLIADVATMREMSFSIAGMFQAGFDPGLEAAAVKDLAGTYAQELPAVARALFPMEPDVGSDDPFVAHTARSILNAPRYSIAGGTREILRGIIARGLGLR